MKLDAYLQKTKRSVTGFAIDAGIDRGSVRKILSEQQVDGPSVRVAAAIHRATKGRVKYEDLIPRPRRAQGAG